MFDAIGLPELMLLALFGVLGWQAFKAYRRFRQRSAAARKGPPIEEQPLQKPQETTEREQPLGPIHVDPPAKTIREGTDVFLSYASADRAKAEELAVALSWAGWGIWWDRRILPGKVFDGMIESALDEAKCVVVLWSRASVASNWVRGEAGEGMRREILIPAMIEETKIPLEFRRIQTADLTDWQLSSSSHRGFHSLCASIAATGAARVVP
jgi:hypothetical protein